MEIKKTDKKKIFVTGYSGSGKTTYAKKYEELFNIQYISFDDNWEYEKDLKEQQGQLIAKYTDEFITDAIPYVTENGKYLFLDQYYNAHKDDIKIICVFCADINELQKRRPDHTIVDNVEHFYNCNGGAIEFFRTFPDVDIEYFDTIRNEYVTYDEFREQIRNYLKTNFKSYLDSLSYDKNYGAIECINFPGYTNSRHTWDNIKNLVDWKDKKVADLGCFHGYFAFKAAQAGAKVTGLDKSTAVLQTTRIINYIEGSPIELKQWEGGEEVSSDFDITLALNVIHHFEDLKKALANIKSETVIFEVNQENIEPISEQFNIVKRVNSHRHSFHGVPREILLCERK